METELLENIKALIEASESNSPDETQITDMSLLKATNVGAESPVLLLRYKGKSMALSVERF